MKNLTHTQTTNHERFNVSIVILAEKRAKIQKEIEDLNKKDEEFRDESKTTVKEEKLKNGDDLSDLRSSKLDNELKANRQSAVSKDVEDGECNSNGETTNEINADNQMIVEDNLLDDKNGSIRNEEETKSNELNDNHESSQIEMNEDESNSNSRAKLEDQSNHNSDSNQNDTQDENSQPLQPKSTDKALEDKEFEPIYDE